MDKRRPWRVVRKKLRTDKVGSKVSGSWTIEALTAEGALAEARRRYACASDEWFAIQLPGVNDNG